MIDMILTGLALVLLCIAVHSAVTVFTYHIVLGRYKHDTKLQKVIKLDVIVISLLIATVIEGIIWAQSYLFMGAFQSMEEALYFSLVTYTTLGYGDLTLTDEHRLLGAIEAATGVIMLGWSTAIVVFTIQRVYFSSRLQ